MRNRYQIIALSLLTILLLPQLSLADPMVMSAASFIFIPLLLVLEGIIISFLARSSRVYRVRFVAVWFFVTLVTLVPLFASSAYLENMTGNTISVLIAEIIVVIIEAWAIFLLLRWKFLSANIKKSPSYGRWLIYSLIANLVSFGGSYLSLLIPF